MVEFIRIMSRALKNETYGVNAQIANLPHDFNDPPIPQIKAIIDSTQKDEDVAALGRGIQVLDSPVLVVTLQNPIESNVEFADVMRQYNDCDIFIDIVVASLDAAPTTRDLLYIIRAIIACIRDLMAEENNDTDQNMNDICYESLNRITWGPVNQQIEGGVIVGTVIPNFNIRDRNP